MTTTLPSDEEAKTNKKWYPHDPGGHSSSYRLTRAVTLRLNGKFARREFRITVTINDRIRPDRMRLY
jgi:hypothetical protein